LIVIVRWNIFYGIFWISIFVWLLFITCIFSILILGSFIIMFYRILIWFWNMLIFFLFFIILLLLVSFCSFLLSPVKEKSLSHALNIKILLNNKMKYFFICLLHSFTQLVIINNIVLLFIFYVGITFNITIL